MTDANAITTVRALNDFFNKDDAGKAIIGVATFNAEIKALSPEEKAWMGAEAAKAMGKTIKVSA
jgi:hypothetical protein